MILSTCVRSLTILALSSICLAGQLKAESPPTIQVNGSGQAETQPKIMRLELHISSKCYTRTLRGRSYIRLLRVNPHDRPGFCRVLKG
jgi:hypothetical protein